MAGFPLRIFCSVDAPGWTSGPPVRILTHWMPPGRRVGPGTFLAETGFPQKHTSVMKWLRGEDSRDSPYPNELYGPWDPFGGATLPQTMLLFLERLQHTVPDLQDIQGKALGLPCMSYFPCGLPIHCLGGWQALVSSTIPNSSSDSGVTKTMDKVLANARW